MTYTQGKWEIKLADNGEQTGLILGNGGLYHVCDTGIAGSYNMLAAPNANTNIELVKQHIETAKANARLIAAAPEMLEMLKELTALNNCNYHPATSDFINAWQKARQLINQIEAA